MNRPTPALLPHALAAAALLSLAACGGGDADPPPAPADTTAPTLTITDDVSATTATTTSPVTFSFQFSEDVGTSFTQSDVTVAGGTAGTLTRVSATLYTLAVTPAADAAGTITVDVAAASYRDAAGNTGAARSATQAYDTRPVVTQTTLLNFQESPAPTLAGFGGAEDAAVVADPTDASNQVARITKAATAESWAGVTLSRCAGNTLPVLPFSASNTRLQARVWSPDAGIPVRLKVENAADGTQSVETEATVTTAAGWQTLTWNFANQAAGTAALDVTKTYNRASIFFGFGTTGAQAGAAKTYYVDDLAFVGATFDAACPSTGGGNTKVIRFSEATAPVMTGFGGAEDSGVVVDPTDSANRVGRITKAATAELWAGTTISTGAGLTIDPIAFSATNTTVTMRVWAPDANTPIRVKVENSSNGAQAVETEVRTGAAATWQTLSFNFANQVAGTPALSLTGTYDKLSVFPNFGTTGAQAGSAKTYYVDDITYEAGTPPAPVTSTLPVTFDAAGVTYVLTGFGGAEDSGVVNDPAGGSNKVGRVTKAATAESWAGATISTGPGLTIARVPFAAGATRMTLRVYSPAANVPIRLKLENSSNGAESVETEARTTTANAWETLTFDFANQAAGTAALDVARTYDKASVFPNFGTTGANGGGGTWYFDDLAFAGAAAGKTAAKARR
jgi:hypothetical protein